MCIFVVSSANKKFPLILIDNRDEILERPTAPAHWWEGTNIYAPQDLGSPMKGTWIGVTKTGRFAVLVNAYEEAKTAAKLSRGGMAKLYLESELPPHQWIEWLKKAHGDYMQESGRFTMLVGEYSRNDSTVHYEFVSNYESEVPQADSTTALSNGSIKDESWTKVKEARRLFEQLLQIDSAEKLVDESLNLLTSTKSAPLPAERKDLRKYIFVPRCIINGVPYGTRTQTVILIDHNGNLTFVQRDVNTGATSHEKFTIPEQN